MAVDVLKLQFVGGEIPCLEHAIAETIEKMERNGQGSEVNVYRFMRDKINAAPREQV